MSKNLPKESFANQPPPLDKDLAQVLMGAVSDAVVITDLNGRIEDANAIASQFTGWPITGMIGHLFPEVFHFVDEDNPSQSLDILDQNSGIDSVSNRKRILLVGENETEYAIHNAIFPILDAQRTQVGSVIILKDISKLKTLGLQLLWHSNHDAITGLENRFAFEEKLSQSIKAVSMRHESKILCHVDIDQFKLLNDSCGSAAGDQLLRQIAIFLKDQIRSEDVLARIGGDEFGILFHDCTVEQAFRIASDIQRQVEKFHFLWQGKTFPIGLSMGLAKLESPSLKIDVLLQQSEMACHAAKTKGKGQIQFFALDDMQISDLVHHQEWSLIIRDALKAGRFQLFRQPIVSSIHANETPQHFEVLVRMLGDANRIIAPNRFISTAERYDLMPALDQWIVERCLVHLEMNAQDQPQDQSSSPVYSINLSGSSFSDDKFLDYLLNRVKNLSLPQESICFEITETQAISDVYRTRDFMGALRTFGCLFSLDDFGSGMSSFSYLQHLPIDFLKIDGKFIRNIEENVINYSIVESISTISKKIGLKTIAEMVENQRTLQCLQTIGVNFIQGFVTGKPIPWC